MERTATIRHDSYEGSDTLVCAGDDTRSYLYFVVCVGEDNRADIIDGRYRSYEEAIVCWPQAAVRAGAKPP